MPKIGKGPDYKYCEICRPNNFHIADSDHTLEDSKMPGIFIEIFKFFERSHVVLNRYEMCENRFLFNKPHTLYSVSTNDQIFNLITAVKETCLHVSKNPRAANWTRLQFLAKIITAVRHVLTIRKKTGLQYNFITDFSNFIDQFQIHMQFGPLYPVIQTLWYIIIPHEYS